MRVFGLVRSFHRCPAEITLSDKARKRLKILDDHRRGVSIEDLCICHEISRATFYRLKARFDPHDLTSLEDRSRRPRQTPRTKTPDDIIDAIVALRRQHMTWGKTKLRKLLAASGIVVSASTIGRVIRRRKLFAVHIVKRSRRAAKSHKPRPPRELAKLAPGSVLQLDTKHVYPQPGVHWYHLTALDTATRMRHLRLVKSKSSLAAARFLDEVLSALPFKVRAVHTDNGSEFALHFEAAVKERGLAHYFSRPRTPTDLGLLERSHRTDDDEFYGLVELDAEIERDNARLDEWTRVYNEVRPHAALGMLTPKEAAANGGR